MTASNHAITGAVIGAAIANPIALPLAFLSHFVLDSIPHFGIKDESFGKKFRIYLSIDALVGASLGLYLLWLQPENLILIYACMILAVSPDFYWAYRWYKQANKGEKFTNYSNGFAKFHSKIQWFEKPIGLLLEIPFFIMLVLLNILLK